MDLTILAIPAFLGLLALEAWLAHRRGNGIHLPVDSAASIAMGLGSLVVGFAWKGAELAVYVGVYQYSPFEWHGGIVAWIAAIVVVDFAYYVSHRMHHEVRLLWAVHVVHHSSRHYNLATALRQPWVPFSGLLFYAPVCLLFPPHVVISAYAVNLIYQFWVHTELIDRLGAFEWIFNTPSHHRVHHGANVEYLDRNYAGILILWDRLFGSFEPERETPRYGLTKDITSYNPFVIALHEWIAIGRDLRRSEPLRTRLGRALRPPGWSPDGSSHTAGEMKAAARLGHST